MKKQRFRKPKPILTPLFKQEREMMVSRDEFETRIAFLEEGRLSEYYYERKEETSIVGNIYKGKVTAVLPGLQAAFVDIGLEKSGFLHARDILTESLTVEDFLRAQNARKQEDQLSEEALTQVLQENEKREGGNAGGRRLIQDLLKKGQEIMVQVEKEPISTKGPRLTGQIAIPSRLVVLIPQAEHTGVSHRIATEGERSRLKKILDKVTPKGFGVIARTSAEGAEEKHLKSEIAYLVKLWRTTHNKLKKAKAPSVLYAEEGLLNRVARDMLTVEDKRILIDAPQEGKQIKKWLGSFLSSIQPEIELYKGDAPLFETLNLEAEVEKALRSKVWLKCGGYLVIEETEALVVVDVNTGRNVGRGKQDDTILKTNMEAAQEIGRQLRLRDLGGIIVLDFIDMRSPEHKERVYQELCKVVRRDRAKTSIRKLTDLGIIEMTRKRVRGSLLRSLCDPCPVCQGRGWAMSAASIRLKFKRVLNKAVRLTDEKILRVELSPFWMNASQQHAFFEEAALVKVKLKLVPKPELRPEEIRILSATTDVVIVGNE